MTNTPPGPTGPLPRGWHRVTWTSHGKPQWVVTSCVSSAVALYGELDVTARESPWIADVRIEHWQPTN